MPAATPPPKLTRRIDLGVPDEDAQDQQPRLTLGAGQPPAQPPISDAQATDLNQDSTGLSLNSGYAAMPVAPRGVMGGELTKPDDFSQQVQAQTVVPSKGGPPVEDLYASTGKGPVGKLKKPSETTSTAKAPEDKTPPNIDTSKWPSVQLAPAATPTPTPAPTPTPTPTTDQKPAEKPVEKPAEQTTDQQEVPPSLQNAAFKANIAKYGGASVLGTDQDYSGLDTSVTQDPNFAGLGKGGRPVFFDPKENRFYYKDDTAPGTEVRHYKGALPGNKDDNLEVVDENKANITRDAQTRLAALIQAQHQITDYQNQLQNFRKNNLQDINPAQRLVLAKQMQASGPGLWDSLLKAGANAAAPGMHISDEIYNLEAARNNVANLAGQASSRNLPESERTRSTLELPDIQDDLQTQERKINAIQARLQDEAATYYKMYPFANKWLKDSEAEAMGPERAKALGLIKGGRTSGFTAQPAAQPSPKPSASPSPTPRKPTVEEAQAAPQINTPDDVKKYRSGTLVRDTDGKLKYVP
jgi:outer membrane biosynthesis protein TonB